MQRSRPRFRHTRTRAVFVETCLERPESGRTTYSSAGGDMFDSGRVTEGQMGKAQGQRTSRHGWCFSSMGQRPQSSKPRETQEKSMGKLTIRHISVVSKRASYYGVAIRRRVTFTASELRLDRPTGRRVGSVDPSNGSSGLRVALQASCRFGTGLVGSEPPSGLRHRSYHTSA